MKASLWHCNMLRISVDQHLFTYKEADCGTPHVPLRTVSLGTSESRDETRCLPSFSCRGSRCSTDSAEVTHWRMCCIEKQEVLGVSQRPHSPGIKPENVCVCACVRPGEVPGLPFSTKLLCWCWAKVPSEGVVSSSRADASASSSPPRSKTPINQLTPKTTAVFFSSLGTKFFNDLQASSRTFLYLLIFNCSAPLSHMRELTCLWWFDICRPTYIKSKEKTSLHSVV